MSIHEPSAQRLEASAERFARLRSDEYAYLDEQGQVYLDYTGSGLPARSQLAAHAERISGGCYGNPHSDSPASAASTTLVEAARVRVLEHLGADPAEYAAVFTANATGACRLVGEAFPFRRGGRLVLPLDNHNSVNGLREFARAGHARVVPVPFGCEELRISDEAMAEALSGGRGRRARGGRRAGAAGSAGPACWPTPRRATSPASSTPWSGSNSPTATATPYCWTPPPTCRPTRWTSPRSSPTSSRSAGTRSSAIRPAWAAWWPVGTRSACCAGPGSPAAPSMW